ncbi:MAG: N-formylglutamate amidohydrolase, partial [Rhodobacteraceae bacterium]|nr:N-formylglutamate amidohydrolase [Paracoccaceae bacterium]
PYLFEGTLPDFNIGTMEGASCDPRIGVLVQDICARAEGFSSVRDGRFKGGWTTRHYGQPSDGVHAIQMELAQSTHLATEAPPFAYDPKRASRLRPVLAEILARLAALAPDLRGSR